MEKILIVDDSAVQAKVLQGLLEGEYQVMTCNQPLDTMAKAWQFEPCLILLDIIMPQISGFDVLRSLKSQESTKDIPVILISSMSDVGHEKQGLDLGAVDYIVKPYSEEIVKARVRTHVRIYVLQRSMEQLMQTDALTGVYNRRYVDDVCHKAWQRAMDKGERFSLGLLDVDYFKKYNDQYGHLQGDDALRDVALCMTQCLGAAGQFVARYGGEEFLFGMESLNGAESQALGQGVRSAIEGLQIPHEASLVGPVVTASIGGITRVPQPGETLEGWLRQVDGLLYRAKSQGRNQVVWQV